MEILAGTAEGNTLEGHCSYFPKQVILRKMQRPLNLSRFFECLRVVFFTS